MHEPREQVYESLDGEQLRRLFPVIYDELRGLAGGLLRRERANHTLQPTALVSEAYVRIAEGALGYTMTRTDFFRFAASIMRRVLVDHARARLADKRGGGFSRAVLVEHATGDGEKAVDTLALDEALNQLAKEAPLSARVAELRFFAGLSVQETADTLSMSAPTVKREWAYARQRLEVLLGE